MSSRRLLSTAAFIVLIVFLGVFLIRVPRVDLGTVMLITLALVAYDLWLQLWRRRPR